MWNIVKERPTPSLHILFPLSLLSTPLLPRGLRTTLPGRGKAACRGWGVWRGSSRRKNAFSLIRSRPGKPNQRKGPKRKIHEFRPFLWILVFFLRKTSMIHIELLFRNAPVKSSWTDLCLAWFAGATPDKAKFRRASQETFFLNTQCDFVVGRPSLVIMLQCGMVKVPLELVLICRAPLMVTSASFLGFCFV